MEAANPAQVNIRRMTPADLPAVADLCAQLGYPATALELQSRFGRLQEQDRDALFVAESANGEVVGWIHVVVAPSLTLGTSAEIKGLVVDARVRDRGFGGRLMAAAEEWISNRGCRRVRLRSRITRERAHRFYELRGYSRVKAQHVFEKELG